MRRALSRLTGAIFFASPQRVDPCPQLLTDGHDEFARLR
jgi:hypothetical protein